MGGILCHADVGNVGLDDLVVISINESSEGQLNIVGMSRIFELDIRWLWSSTFAKQLSVIRFLSSSNRSARDMADAPVAELEIDGGPPGAPGGRRFSPLGLLLPPGGMPFGPLRGRPPPSMIVHSKRAAVTLLICTAAADLGQSGSRGGRTSRG